MSSRQIKTLPATKYQQADGVLNSREIYECANADITRGFTAAPSSLEECLVRFPQIQTIWKEFGVGHDTFYGATFSGPAGGIGVIKDLYTGITSEECKQINSLLGPEWLGCLWGSPMAPFSCSCPYIGEKFEAYLKLRLNVASFWKTPVKVPVERKAFLDELKYNTKVELTVAGDFKLTPGSIIEILVDHPTRYANDTAEKSLFSGLYMVLSVKHVFTNGGTHETALTATALPNKN